MPYYLKQPSYADEALNVLLKNPQNHVEAVRPACAPKTGFELYKRAPTRSDRK